MTDIRDIAASIGGRFSGPAVEVRGVTHNAQTAAPGLMFAAIQGAKSDGHNYIPQALERGATAVLSERPAPPDFPAAWVQVDNIRFAMAQAANVVYGHPTCELKLAAITGTNGKTTTVYLLDAIFRAAHGISAMLSTVEYRIGDDSEVARLTTPEASEVQAFMRRAVLAGCPAAAMEASSVALDVYRVADVRFAAAIFSNLTQDHLDYHGTMENYFDAKLRLFDGRNGELPGVAVLNLDDSYGERIHQTVKDRVPVVRYGLKDSAERPLDYWLDAYATRPSGLELTVHTPDGPLPLKSRLVGQPHAYNILAATATARALGIAPEHIAAGVAAAVVPGRFELVETGDLGFLVAVDYAHTPDAVVNVTASARALARDLGGRVITLFGCGGDKDRTKRPLMAKAAGEGSDLVVMTSDNPRSESPEAILDDAEVGLRDLGVPYHRIVDRREAIEFAIRQAQPNDVVVLAGKGHETYQILSTGTIHFDDREEARAVLQRLPGKGAAHAN